MPLSDNTNVLSDTNFARAMLQADEIPVDARGGYRRLTQRAAGRVRSIRRFSIAAGAVAAIALCCIALPVGSYARQFLAIFEPHAFVPLYVTALDRKNSHAPAVANLGQVHSIRPMSRVRVSSPQAVADAGFRPFLPPATALDANAKYYFLPAGRVDFSFERSRADAYARRLGRTFPEMPASLDGTDVRITSGPGMVAEFRRDNGQTFSIVEMHAPKIASTGASMGEIERYVSSLPGFPRDVAAQLNVLGDPSTMLPIPLKANSGSASTIDIHGASALAVGDQTGLGSGVVWQANGIVYAVAGTIGLTEAVRLANALE